MPIMPRNQGKNLIVGSFFTKSSFDEIQKTRKTKHIDKIQQGYEPNKGGSGVLYRWENIPLAYYDIPTLNQVVFSKRLWENLRNSDVIKSAIDSGSFWGEGSHADRDEVIISDVAMRVTDFRISSNNLILGDVELLDTPNGVVAYTLAKVGAIGNSSRGWGSLEQASDGVNQIVSDTDYIHTCWDLVTFPAVPDAKFPLVSSIKNNLKGNKKLQESLEESLDSRNLSLNFGELKQILMSYDGLVEKKKTLTVAKNMKPLKKVSRNWSGLRSDAVRSAKARKSLDKVNAFYEKEKK